MSVDIGPVDAFSEGEPHRVVVDGRSVCVVRAGGHLYALRSICPHQAAPLDRGLVLPRLGSADGVGSISIEGSSILSCPWHGWEFDLETGRTDQPSMRVKSYPVDEVAGRVILDAGRQEGAPSSERAVSGGPVNGGPQREK